MPRTGTNHAEPAPAAEKASAGAEAGPGGQDSTRERILWIALDLFTTQGYEKTSLRQIAGRLGFSKAAIYYHFASKEDILMALDFRLHEFGRDALSTVDPAEASQEAWVRSLYRLIDQILKHHALFALHERNRAALAQLHRERHDFEYDDFEEWFRVALSNRAIALHDRVRMGCAFGAVMSVLDLVGDEFSDVPSATLAVLLRDAVNDFMAPSQAPA
ncbi:MAG: TetR/AcrR family transcriptional regulator [Acidimicrobiales bacterium]